MNWRIGSCNLLYMKIFYYNFSAQIALILNVILLMRFVLLPNHKEITHGRADDDFFPTEIGKWCESEQACHPERSEGSDSPGTEILRCAQDDNADFDC